MSVLVIGNATVDLCYAVDRLPVAGETRLTRRRSMHPGGKGLNQAMAAARAGADTRLSAPIGQDAQASYLRARIEAASGLAFRPWVHDMPTDESSIWISETQAGENMIVSTVGCASAVTADEAVRALAEGCCGDWLVMQGNLTADATYACLVEARRKGMHTLLNPAPLQFDPLPMGDAIDLLVVNAVEGEGIGGAAAWPGIAARLGEGLIVTRGAQGALLVRPDGTSSEHRVAPAEAVDTTGAGDAFVGALVAERDAGGSLDSALAAGLRAGRLTVERPGSFLHD